MLLWSLVQEMIAFNFLRKKLLLKLLNEIKKKMKQQNFYEVGHTKRYKSQVHD